MQIACKMMEMLGIVYISIHFHFSRIQNIIFAHYFFLSLYPNGIYVYMLAEHMNIQNFRFYDQNSANITNGHI